MVCGWLNIRCCGSGSGGSIGESGWMKRFCDFSSPAFYYGT